MSSKNKGFTLLELVIVVAVIAILIGIAVPIANSSLERVRYIADVAQLKSLNDATQAYATQYMIVDEDIFSEFYSDPTRMQELVDENYFQSAPEPMVDGEEFKWGIKAQRWSYTGDVFRIVFDENFDINQFLTQNIGGAWLATEDGLEGTKSYIFIPNERDEYTITTVAQMEETDGKNGYKIMFETYVNENNSKFGDGYSLYYDCTNNEVKIIDSDGKSIGTADYSNNAIIAPDSSNGWWEDQHEIVMDITRVDESTKQISVWIDDTPITFSTNDGSSDSVSFDDLVATEDSNTGFRVYSSETEFKEITIE